MTDLDLFLGTFARVNDAYGVETPKGPKAVRRPPSPELIRAHLTGEIRIGFYTTGPDGLADQIVIDIDIPKEKAGEPAEWERARSEAKRVLAVFDELGIEAFITSSKSRGYHVRALCEPTPAGILRKIGEYVCKRAGVVAEVFPKQAARGEDGLGNFVWAPMQGESLKHGKTAILDGGNGLDPMPDQWEALRDIRRNSHETLATIQAVIEEQEKDHGPALSKLAPPVGETIPDGKRSDSLISLAGTMRRRGMSEGAIAAALLEENRSKCSPPLPEKEVRDIARSGSRYEPAAPATETEPFRATDLWAARLFVRLHGYKAKFCERLGGWYVYDGKRWKRSEAGEVERLAKDTVRQIYELAALEPNDARRIDMAKHAARMEAAGKLQAILDLAATEKEVAVSPEAFDARPWLLNVQNGTLDLRTAELREHRPEDMLTNLSPAEWQGLDVKGERFEAFLQEAMDGDQEKINFLRRAAGYTLSGDMREQVFIFLHGPEAGGKGTKVRALADVMGTYARSTEIGTFLTARRDAVRNDIASLVGARLVTASEPEDGQTFDEGLIKILTGQDRTTARFLFREAFEFSATFKLWLQGNHRPHIRSTGGAMWRRLLIVPFTKTVPEERRDKTLGDKLRTPEERAGILAWMVRGCLDWQRDGLHPPDSVRAAVADYRAAEDRLAPFLEEKTSASNQGEVTAGKLYAEYKAWAEANGERPMSKRTFGIRLEEKGYVSIRKAGGTRAWSGLFLVDRGEE